MTRTWTIIISWLAIWVPLGTLIGSFIKLGMAALLRRKGDVLRRRSLLSNRPVILSAGACIRAVPTRFASLKNIALFFQPFDR